MNTRQYCAELGRHDLAGAGVADAGVAVCADAACAGVAGAGVAVAVADAGAAMAVAAGVLPPSPLQAASSVARERTAIRSAADGRIERSAPIAFPATLPSRRPRGWTAARRAKHSTARRGLEAPSRRAAAQAARAGSWRRRGSRTTSANSEAEPTNVAANSTSAKS